MDSLRVTSASSTAGVPALPGSTCRRTEPTEFAAAPFASGLPTVRCDDDWTGGLQDGCASGGPCSRFGAVQGSYAGTSDMRSGPAPFGRGYPPVVTDEAYTSWARSVSPATSVSSVSKNTREPSSDSPRKKAKKSPVPPVGPTEMNVVAPAVRSYMSG